MLHNQHQNTVAINSIPISKTIVYRLQTAINLQTCREAPLSKLAGEGQRERVSSFVLLLQSSLALLQMHRLQYHSLLP